MSLQVEDFTPLADKAIEENTKIAQNGELHRAIETLLAVEKQTRQGNDSISTGRLLICITDLCFKANDFKALKENIILLSKRRGQLKQAVKMMVKHAMNYLEGIDKPTEIDLIDTLLKISEGKIFVEKQRARLTMRLSKIRESEGNIEEAARILQEVQVETFGSMKKKEKTEFILEQMRLCLDKNDFIRAQIVSKKISSKVLGELEPVKIEYHKLMIRYYTHHEDYLNIFRCYQEIYSCPSIKQDLESMQKYLKYSTAYILLSPHDVEQNTLINLLATDKNFETIPDFKKVLQEFLTIEIIFWKQLILKYNTSFDALLSKDEQKNFWEVLHVRVIEHNLRVLEKYYSSISIARIAELLDLEPSKAEEHICALTTKKTIYARINRKTGEVNFIKPKKPSDILNDWSSDITNLLSVVEKTCHMIQREYMVYGSTQTLKE